MPSEALLQAVQAATSVVKAHRTHGHLAAALDPLGSPPRGDPALDPESVSLTDEQMHAIPACVLRVAVPGETFADALPHLRETYCGHDRLRGRAHRRPQPARVAAPADRVRRAPQAARRRARKRLLKRLSEVEALETYLHKAFLGKKQFSIEGLDALLPMLDEAIEIGTEAGARDVVLGMAHRGRLNVLAHTVGLPYARDPGRVRGRAALAADTAAARGRHRRRQVPLRRRGHLPHPGRRGVTVTLSHNPSHLEFIDPVIEGRARADQTSRKGREPNHDPSVVLPVLMHGDAAFPGQGVVAETLNLQALPGYTTGGTVHVITNNQLGFTTNPSESPLDPLRVGPRQGLRRPDHPRQRRRRGGLRRGDAPGHGLPPASSAATPLIDLIGYRRYGHNETDEPAYTQPAMYEAIKAHPPVRKIYAEKLVAEGVVTEDEARKMLDDATTKLSDAHDELKESMGGDAQHQTGEHELDRTMSREPRTTVPGRHAALAQRAAAAGAQRLHRAPQARAPAREAAQDARRGGRHRLGAGRGAVLRLAAGARRADPPDRPGLRARHLLPAPPGAARLQDRRPLRADPEPARRPRPVRAAQLARCRSRPAWASSTATRCRPPTRWSLWEAQFGDFVNGAQVVIDQFLVSGLAKWGQTSRLTLLLPHGYEGSGPEHSSARLERFLQLAAEGNIRVANPTTPAQYFHLLRRQALVGKAAPAGGDDARRACCACRPPPPRWRSWPTAPGSG